MGVVGLARRAGLLLAVGVILFVFSERMFWSVVRPGDEVVAYVGGWLLYTFLGYVLLAVCSVFRVRDLVGLYLAGACFGWLGEGVVAMTLFGDASMPFPLTVSWTGLAWHALITVMVGFYALRRCLQSASAWPALALSAGIGAFWGIWGAGWQAESPPVGDDATGFFAHAALSAAALAAAQAALTPAGLAAFRPARPGLVAACLLIALYLGAVTIPAVPFAPLILVPLFALPLWVLWRRRAPEESGNVLSVLGRGIRFRNLVGLVALPVVAAVAYAAMGSAAAELPIHLPAALVLSVAGLGLLLAALWTAVRTRLVPREPAAPQGLR